MLVRDRKCRVGLRIGWDLGQTDMARDQYFTLGLFVPDFTQDARAASGQARLAKVVQPCEFVPFFELLLLLLRCVKML